MGKESNGRCLAFSSATMKPAAPNRQRAESNVKNFTMNLANFSRASLCLAALAAAGTIGSLAARAIAEGGASTGAPGRHVDFVKDVQPILKASCIECHNAKKHKANLRLDNREDAFKGGDGGKSIMPGHAKDSLLITRVLGQGDDPAMPFKKPALPKDQIDILTAWVDQGADWPATADGQVAKTETHWAYVKPVRPAVPNIGDPNLAAWCRNDVDRFIAAGLEKEGLRPSSEAPRDVLIRRVSLDLIGLPPTAKEVDDFVNDPSPDAYEKVVDRLLASPHYGERSAIRWLDLARYADSNGYEKDRRRSMWPYRDWVINAFNADMPFDEFTIEQLAGDLLPNATVEQKVATGFNRNTMINEEGGTDPDEFLYYAEVDRVSTTATVWLGSTLACAQCHNHKYDPFTQKDYYQFLAYFNSTADEGQKIGTSDPHDISVRVTVDPPEVKDLQEQIAGLKKQLDTPTPELESAQAKWEKQHELHEKADTEQTEVAWTPLQVTDVKSSGGVGLSVQPDGSVLASGTTPPTATYTVTATTTTLTKITGLRLEALTDDSLPVKGPGRSPGGNFALTHFAVTAAPLGDAAAKGKPVKLKDAIADFSQDQWPVENAIAAKPNPKTGWAVVPETGQSHWAVFEVDGDAALPGGTALTFTLQQSSPYEQHEIGRFRLSATADAHPIPPHAKQGRGGKGQGVIPRNVQLIIDMPADQRNDKQKNELAAYYRTVAPELQPVRQQIMQIQQRIESYPRTSLVMQELPKPRESHIHIRGGFLTLGDKVVPGTPAVFNESAGAPSSGTTPAPEPSTGAPIQNRLDLARWLVSKDNPLTARVTVNRLWEQHFGKGIVATSEDFGTQGERPSNQALLDYLATELMSPSGPSAKPWSMKAINRLIVTSAAYRQSSDVPPALAEKDPFNRLLARGPRFRLPAELIRDEALTVSGLLCPKVGGPSVFPPQPAGIWHSPYNGDTWSTSTGEDRYRRGIYTFLRRSSPYPEFTSFDMTTHEAICTRRSITDTPLQALTTLNDPAFMQPAAALARRILTEGGPTLESRTAFAFGTVLIRSAKPAEVKRIGSLYSQMLKKYDADPKAAAEVADSGLGAPPKELSTPELAAWTMVSNVLLNLDETLTTE
jgi:hypothetical protein